MSARTAVATAEPDDDLPRVWRGERSGAWCYECSCGQKGAYDEEAQTRSVLQRHLENDERHRR